MSSTLPSGTTAKLPGINAPDKGLLFENLEAALKHEFEGDARFQPLLELLAAFKDDNIDYASSEIDQIISHMVHLNKGLETAPLPRPKYKVVPFEPRVKKETFVEEVEEKVEAGLKAALHFEALTKPFLSHADVEQVVGEDQFKNWGKTVNFRASYTLVVRSIAGVCEVVKWAANLGKKVRVAGFRHSWSDVFGKDGDVLIMFLPFETLVDLPYQEPPPTWKTELSGIHPVASVNSQTPPTGKAFYKIMAGTTNEQFRQWCFDTKTFCLPLNVIMVEVTFGGTNAPICHGSGLSTTTLSDLVVEVQYVDVKGEVRTINDKNELRAASGAFGLLGVVVAVTLQLDTMGVTDMSPVKLPIPLAIPPPPDYPLPYEISQLIKKKNITKDQLEQAQKDFERRCETDYYLEWFWFPYQEDIWINTWSKRDITPEDLSLQAYPGDGLLDGVKSQQVQATLAETLVSYTPFRWLSGRLQAYTMGLASLLALPNVTQEKDAIKTFQSEAEHFRRGIQNFRCWDTEWEIPVPKVNNKPDYELIQRAWWDGLSAIYSRKDAPVRVALEMRLTGGSNVLLAPQRGNDYTCSIEVLTTLITPKDDWATFMQQIADKWTKYGVKDAAGNLMYPRPHWAKQWAGLQIHGKPIERYLKEDAYRGAFEEFRAAFKGIVEKNGSTVEQTLNVFGNNLMTRLIFQ